MIFRMLTRGETPVVLLVDDEPALLELHEMYLSETCEVLTATGGEEALTLVDDSVDVILLDRRMPDRSGDEVLDTLRERGYDVPVGLISAVKPDRDIVDLPLDDYLTKPITANDLRDTVEHLAMRAHFDPVCREYFRLASKKSALEAGGRLSGDHSEAVQGLAARMEAIHENVDGQLTDLNAGASTDPASPNDLSDQVWDVCLSSEPSI